MEANSVGKMIELLQSYPAELELVNEQNLNFIHISPCDDNRLILSTRRPQAHCRICIRL